MSNNAYRDSVLVQRLLDLTKAGKLAWQEAVVPDEYEVSIPKYSVRIRKANGVGHIAIEIINQFGSIVETIEEPKVLVHPDNIFAELYEAARNKALKAEGIIDDLIESLDEIARSDSSKWTAPKWPSPNT